MSATVVAALGLTLAGVASPATADPSEASLTSLVNTFIGSSNGGNTFPGATVPFGSVQISPDNGFNIGYAYERTSIRGFSLSHLSVGCPLGGVYPVLPTTGDVTETDYGRYAEKYQHASAEKPDAESASPGYYQVQLASAEGTINAELTATTHTAVQRYTFPATTKANVMLNTGQSLNKVESSEVRIIDSRTVEATIVSSGFCQGTDPVTFYLRTTFDRDFQTSGTWKGSAITPASAASSAANERNGAYVTFDTTDDQVIEATTSVSYVDAQGAKLNLEAESASFDEVRAAADQVWEDKLGLIKAEGGADVTDDERKVFYSALYRALLTPTVGQDVDGRYTGWDQQIHRAEGFTYYQNFSLWDTYRTQQQLLYLIAPKESADQAYSLVLQAQQFGWLPRWGYNTVETNIMTGDPATPFLVSAWSQGLLKGHEEVAYQVLKQNADGVPPAESFANGRMGNPWFIADGYVPSDDNAERKPGDFDLAHGGSASLEYALSDAMLSVMARGLGHTEDADRYAARGQNYLANYDPTVDSFATRNYDGTFVGNKGSVISDGFHEGTAAQYRWLVPQDIPGLIDILGGREKAIEFLDGFFSYDTIIDDPAGTARTKWVYSAYDYYTKNTYNPNNEPDLHAPYVYLWLGEPWKTIDVVRAGRTLFTNAPGGVTGNDDEGTMAAWHVLSAIGIYPIQPGLDVWGLVTPMFDKVTITLDPEVFGKESLVITADGVTDAGRYTQGVKVGGANWAKGYVNGPDLTSAGTVDFAVGSAPSDWATGTDAAPPSVEHQPYSEHRITAEATKGTSYQVTAGQSVEIPLNIVAQLPKDARTDGMVSGTVTAYGDPVAAASQPATWEAAASDMPQTTSTTLTIATGADVANGDHQVRLVVSDGVGSVSKVVTLSVSGGSDRAVEVEVAPDATVTEGSGQPLTVTGTGFSPGVAVEAYFDTEIEPATTTASSNAIVSADGTVSVDVIAAALDAGDHTVRLSEQLGSGAHISDSAEFSVEAHTYTPAVELSRSQITEGDEKEITVTGTGFAPLFEVVAQVGSGSPETPLAADADGTVAFAISAADLASGTHPVTLIQDRGKADDLLASAELTVEAAPTPTPDPTETPTPTVTPTPTPTSSTPGGSPTPTPSGKLPVTGSESVVLWSAAATMLAAAGILLAVAARRRRQLSR